jgi:hypothetical protein
MNSNKKVYKREIIKNKILSGSGHKTHYTNKDIEPRRQSTNVLCNCDIKCANLFSENQKQEIFNRYNSLKSHSTTFKARPDTSWRKILRNLILYGSCGHFKNKGIDT